MRHLRLLVVLSIILKQAKKIGTPGKAKDEPVPGVPVCSFFGGRHFETTGTGGSSTPPLPLLIRGGELPEALVGVGLLVCLCLLAK